MRIAICLEGSVSTLIYATEEIIFKLAGKSHYRMLVIKSRKKVSRVT
jgi:hypothetical protein